MRDKEPAVQTLKSVAAAHAGNLRAAGELLWFGAASLGAGLAVALSAAAVVILLA